MKVIPAINETEFSAVLKKAELVERFLPGASFAQLDISDGHFGTRATWNNPEEAKQLPIKLAYELHLMVAEPEAVVSAWLSHPLVKRIVFHIETAADPFLLKRQIEAAGKEAGLAFHCSFPREMLFPILPQFSFWQVVSVVPGESGQIFDDRALLAVRFLREHSPNATIEVDGGVTPKVASFIREAGADLIAASSYIFQNPDPVFAYNELASF